MKDQFVIIRLMATIVALLSFSSQTLSYSPNPVIGAVAKGMRLLKPIFQLEAQIQAAALGSLSNVDKANVVSEIDELKKKNKALIYTYGLSPFSSEAVNILKSTGYEFTNIELGLEWFLLGGKESVIRVALSEQVDDGATSLPKIFIGGKCIGGCSELMDLKESGELGNMLRQAKAKKIN
jgi:glutaredoxin 3